MLQQKKKFKKNNNLKLKLVNWKKNPEWVFSSPLGFLVPGFLSWKSDSFLFLSVSGIEVVWFGFLWVFFSFLLNFQLFCYVLQHIVSDCINHIVFPKVNNILSSYVLFNPEWGLHMWTHRYKFTICCGASSCICQKV